MRPATATDATRRIGEGDAGGRGRQRRRRLE